MWYEILKNYLTNINFVKFFFDHSVFIHENDMIVAVYVNDLLLIEPKLSDVFDFKKKLRVRFRVKNLREIIFYLKIKIIRIRKNRKIKFSQIVFIKRLINDCGFQKLEIRSISIFMKCIDFTMNFNGQTYEAISDEIHAYQIILESLQWLTTMIRQNIVYATNKLAQYIVNSTSTHMQILKRMIRYLTETNDLNIRYDFSNKNEENLMNYSDSAYGDNVIIRRSHSDYVFKLWNDSIFHSSKRQNIVATSFIEIKYIAECNATKKFFFIAQIMIELKHEINDSVDLRADNQNVIKLANNLFNHARTKHIPIQFHYVQKLMKNDYVRITYVNIKNMMTNGLTKALPPEKFWTFVVMLSLTTSVIEKVWNWWKKKMFFHAWAEAAMIIKMKMLDIDSHSCECRANHV